MTQRILLRDLDIPDIGQFDVYVRHGGYGALRQALTTMKPEQVGQHPQAAIRRAQEGAPTSDCTWAFDR